MIYVKDIVNICKGKLVCGDENILCKSFSKDTRTINKGDVYVGIKGEVFDGNTFYKEAIDKGAVVCIIDNEEVLDKKYKKNETIILVDNSVEAILKLAKYKRSLYDIPVVAVTGSVGKTSVKDMITKVLSSKYDVLATKGNMNNNIGLPLTILNLDKENAMVLEMGMNHAGELHILSNVACPDIAVITNIGTAHIGNLGSRENILKAKLEILDGMHHGTLIINNDNDMLRTVKYDNLITIGIDNDSDYMAHDIMDYGSYSKFAILDNYLTVPVGSIAFVYNALFAYAVGRKLGISEKAIEESLKEFSLSPHRLEIIKRKKYTIIDDTYNASLDSVKNALSILSKMDGRKVFIFADILELQEYAKDIHEEIGKLCNEYGVDLLLTVGSLARDTFNKFNGNKKHFNNNDNLLRDINKLILDGDTILVKGSHAMNLIKVVNYLAREE